MEIAETMIALRIHATDRVKCSLDNGVTLCPYYPIGACTSAMAKDALKHIEDLTAQLSDKDYLIQQQADEIERLRRDVKKQQEKMIELAKRSKALEADLDEWTEKAFVNQSKALENLRRIPKSGRWIVEQEGENGINIYCSECGKNGQFPKWNFCPNCGAKMENVNE